MSIHSSFLEASNESSNMSDPYSTPLPSTQPRPGVFEEGQNPTDPETILATATLDSPVPDEAQAREKFDDSILETTALSFSPIAKTDEDGAKAMVDLMMSTTSTTDAPKKKKRKAASTEGESIVAYKKRLVLATARLLDLAMELKED